MTFGEKIKKLRADNNLTQEQLAEMLFVTRTAISKWETDKGLPGIDTMKLISTTFHISMDELVSDDVVESKKVIDDRNARIMYAVAMVFVALTVAFTLTAYFTGNKYFTIGTILATCGFVVFGLLAHPKYKRIEARKLIIPYVISRAFILLFVIGLIIYTVITLR